MIKFNRDTSSEHSGVKVECKYEAVVLKMANLQFPIEYGALGVVERG